MVTLSIALKLTFFKELRHAPLAQGAKAVLNAHADRVVNVPIDDEGSLIDVDTPAEYDRLLKKTT